MAYGTRAGMEAIFGTSRIAKLADPDETQVGASITATINAALAYADKRIDGVMGLTHHRLPLATAAGATPELIGQIANRLAAGWLARQWRLESVPPEDAGERVLQYEGEALGELHAIAQGAMRIDAL
jgi:phage gp36-like protein